MSLGVDWVGEKRAKAVGLRGMAQAETVITRANPTRP
jgi:hypothetical protein